LNDRPHYKALSYVWGDLQNKRSIAVDRQSLEIPRSLFAGLQRLRSKKETVTIWVDAICINQFDVDERSQQVRFMGDIYSSAQEVLIWLGYGGKSEAPKDQPQIYRWTGEDTDMQIVDAYFDQIRPQSNEDNDTEDIVGAFVYLRLRAKGKHIDELPFFDVNEKRLQPRQTWPAVIRALDTLRSNPWWRRIWVVQETVLAREATVIYSHVTVPWNILARAARTSATQHNSCCSGFYQMLSVADEIVLVKVRRVILADIEPMRTLRAEGERLSLWRLMFGTRLREATDVRDKVYGLLGLVSNWQGQPALLADYSVSPKEVFIKAIISHIESTSSLQIIMGTIRNDVFDTPSWITQKGYASEGDRIRQSVLFSAANGIAATVERIGDVLAVEGFNPSDTIASVGPTMGETNPVTWITAAHKVEAWRNMAELEIRTGDIYFGKHSWADAFWRMILNDCTGAHTPPQRLEDTNPTCIAEDFWSWLESLLREREDETPFFKIDLDQRQRFIQSFIAATTHRRFFITTDGRMGLGPPEARPGDFITILLGGNVPFCLRADPDQHSGYYRLIGDTYVHGLMDGEGVPANWKEQVVKIHLR
jgi:hypothetical protein